MSATLIRTANGSASGQRTSSCVTPAPLRHGCARHAAGSKIIIVLVIAEAADVSRSLPRARGHRASSLTGCSGSWIPWPPSRALKPRAPPDAPEFRD
jgi:hypothetical protein